MQKSVFEFFSASRLDPEISWPTHTSSFKTFVPATSYPRLFGEYLIRVFLREDFRKDLRRSLRQGVRKGLRQMR